MNKKEHDVLVNFVSDIEETLLESGLSLYINPLTFEAEGAYVLKNGNLERAVDILYLLLDTIKTEVKKSSVKDTTIKIVTQYIEFLGSKEAACFVVTH
jgi:hypothetical protein